MAHRRGGAVVSRYDELEEAWLSGEISHAEACEIAREMGYDDD